MSSLKLGLQTQESESGRMTSPACSRGFIEPIRREAERQAGPASGCQLPRPLSRHMGARSAPSASLAKGRTFESSCLGIPPADSAKRSLHPSSDSPFFYGPRETFTGYSHLTYTLQATDQTGGVDVWQDEVTFVCVDLCHALLPRFLRWCSARAVFKRTAR